MKSKKAIKKLKKQLNAEVIELANAIKEDRRNIDELSVKYIRHMKRVSELFAELENKADRYEIKTIAKHVQNLEAEKCSCHTNKPKAEFDKELFGKLFIENFQEESKQVTIDAINQAVYSGHSIIDIMGKYTRNAIVKATAKTIADMVIHTNTQKTDKNATEGKQEGKKEHSETIVTNEMFNEELEKRLNESFIQDHPAFMLLNGFIPSNTIEDLIRAKLKSKGEHYSPNGDRYSNFKRLNNSTASFKQKTVKERIENFMEKHEIWIEDYEAGDVNGTLLDLIESCIDVLCYYLLLDIHLKFNPEA